jgi:hypothetical protein
MTREEFESLMNGNDEFLKWDRVEGKRSQRRDLHGFLLLDELQPGKATMISAAEHDEYWLDINIDKLVEVITPEQCIELLRCGIRYDEDVTSLAVYA